MGNSGFVISSVWKTTTAHPWFSGAMIATYLQLRTTPVISVEMGRSCMNKFGDSELCYHAPAVIGNWVYAVGGSDTQGNRKRATWGTAPWRIQREGE